MNMVIKIFTASLTNAIFFVGLLLPLRVYGNNQNIEKAKSGKDVSIAIRTLKNVFEPNEPVPLIVVIANHSAEPVYTYGSESAIYNSSCDVSDANGIRNILGDRFSEGNGFPADYWILKDEKLNLVMPIYRIDSHEVMLAIVEDAIKLYRKNMPEGTYYVGPYFDYILQDVNDTDIIVRKDVPNPLWIEPAKSKTKKYESNSIKIEIRKKTESQKEPIIQTEIKTQAPLAETKPFSWSVFTGGAAAGFCALGLILLLINKSKKHKSTLLNSFISM
jgi:hypothetical protein